MVSDISTLTTSDFHQVLQALLPLYEIFIYAPPSNIPVQIRNDWGKMSYLHDIRGAIHGTQVLANIPASQHAIYRYRKSILLQPVLAGCSLDMYFFYICPGWEASANHARVVDNAELNRFPRKVGATYLADAGYGVQKGFLTPYRTLHYHLRQQVQPGLLSLIIEAVFNL